MKNKSYYVYIFSAIIGFLAFAFSIKYAEFEPLLIIVGIGSATGMTYCVTKLVNFHIRNEDIPILAKASFGTSMSSKPEQLSTEEWISFFEIVI
ncbi:hypothetical protein [Acetobacterium sp.]|uniref:hypothetical protein n=1 Tax=Acetobacterium sp. TaxID=1872094 RepID=UPI002F3F6F2C